MERLRFPRHEVVGHEEPVVAEKDDRVNRAPALAHRVQLKLRASDCHRPSDQQVTLTMSVEAFMRTYIFDDGRAADIDR